MIIGGDKQWSDDIEKVLESIRHNASVMSEYHKKNFIGFKSQLKYYKIPIIIISGLNSVIAVGLQPYMDQGIISGSNCLLALLCGIIGSIELFLGIQASMETELMASKNFYLLAVDIYKTLTLHRKHRSASGKEYLDEKYGEYTKLFENAQVIRSKIKDKLATIPTINDAGEMTMSPSPVTFNDDLDLELKTFQPRMSVKDMDELKEFRAQLHQRNSIIGGTPLITKTNTEQLFSPNYFQPPSLDSSSSEEDLSTSIGGNV
jgi:hypothetical protein